MSFDPYAECLCDHYHEDHDGPGGECTGTATSGYQCRCPEFEEAT